MTGRDLILYILQNNLEDEPVVKDGKLIGFMTVDEAALNFGFGAATVLAWIQLGFLPSVQIGETTYIPSIYNDGVKGSMK